MTICNNERKMREEKKNVVYKYDYTNANMCEYAIYVHLSAVSSDKLTCLDH
jgi:hypothetical protein